MGLGVVADGVAAPENLGDECGVAQDFFTDEKKRGAGSVGVEQIENRRCAEGMRAVVDREPDFTSCGFEVGDCRAKSAGGGFEYL